MGTGGEVLDRGHICILMVDSTSASSALLVGTSTWITVILNDLPWKGTVIILSFLRLPPSTAFWTLVDYEGYSISSKGLLPIVVYNGHLS